MERNTAVMATEKSSGTLEIVRRRVVLRGITPIAFDAYPGDNQTQVEVHQKMYYAEDGKTLCLPVENISSFLSAQNTVSAPQRLGLKGWKKIANACLSFVSIEPARVPFMRDGKPIVFGKFEGDKDTLSGVVIKRHTARVKGGIPNPKVRPFLPLPWQLEFNISIYPTNEIKEVTVLRLFKEGGIALGFGTFRGVFGKFVVDAWE
jgi:hypothetical protein